MHGNDKTRFLRGTKSDNCGRSASVYHVYPVTRATGEGRAKCSRGRGGRGKGIPTALGRMYVYLVVTYYTCGALGLGDGAGNGEGRGQEG